MVAGANNRSEIVTNPESKILTLLSGIKIERSERESPRAIEVSASVSRFKSQSNFHQNRFVFLTFPCSSFTETIPIFHLSRFLSLSLSLSLSTSAKTVTFHWNKTKQKNGSNNSKELFSKKCQIQVFSSADKKFRLVWPTWNKVQDFQKTIFLRWKKSCSVSFYHLEMRARIFFNLELKL